MPECKVFYEAKLPWYKYEYKEEIANLVDFEHILALQRMSILSVTFFSYNFMCSLHVKVFMTINMKKLKFQRLCNAAYGTKHTVFYYH